MEKDSKQGVSAKREVLTIPTYGLGAPDKNPLFFEKRVYQGSCGKVYPVSFIDKVFDEAKPLCYDSVRLENDSVRLVMLPEIGGRIYIGQDKVNDDYDFFYRNDVIKPALVGLAGPWISGGVEFNWPQHHRPSTYMPTDVHLEMCDDGSRTVWMSEHDPMNRMKGMHGIRLDPGSSLIELRARLYNRTALKQTFLWWANLAAKVHENYESFFPVDVHYVADHAVRAQSGFPFAENDYYGVDYAVKPGANDLRKYKNVEVPTSYMVCETDFDFFGGYDFDAEGGFIHVADRHIAPGKKLWTWGNHEFGWAWDRELTDTSGPYVELMAGVYTDNQPDFSYLLPYETKTFSQYWWPYKKIGPVQNATKDAAVRLVLNEDGTLDLGVVASRKFHDARIILTLNDSVLLDETVTICPEIPWQNNELRYVGDPTMLEFWMEDFNGEIQVAYRPVDCAKLERKRALAQEPPLPRDVRTLDELFFIAEHLEQHRHPTRSPELYWQEALRRDPSDARTNLSYGRYELGRGCFDAAASHLQTAIARFTRHHPNPGTGEAHYFLGLVRRFQGHQDEAYAAYYKATWNYEWRSCAYYELAALDCCQGRFERALKHLEASLDTNRQNNKAQVLKAIVLRKTGRDGEALLRDLLAIDPLEHWGRYELGDYKGFFEKSRNDAQTILDVAYDYADAGLRAEAVELLESHHSREESGIAVPNPMGRSLLTRYALAWLKQDAALLEKARSMNADYFFPCRIHDQLLLEWALAQPGADRNAAFGLGNYFFDRKRHEEAIDCWEIARAADPRHATTCRNLGIAYWNVRRDGEAARSAYLQVLDNDAVDPRLFYEYDQLRKKLGDDIKDRLTSLLAQPLRVAERDDCTVELAALYNQTDHAEKALELLLNRRFHPCEGGEGQVLKQYTTARLRLGQVALQNKDFLAALQQFSEAMNPPHNLGEAYHLLQAQADVNYWKGRALRALGREKEAVDCFEASASESGDFQSMAVTEHSELSYYRGLSLLELGRVAEAEAMFFELGSFAEREMEKPAVIDYFATSLPLLLVFDDDLDASRKAEMTKLISLSKQGLTTLRKNSMTR